MVQSHNKNTSKQHPYSWLVTLVVIFPNITGNPTTYPGFPLRLDTVVFDATFSLSSYTLNKTADGVRILEVQSIIVLNFLTENKKDKQTAKIGNLF